MKEMVVHEGSRLESVLLLPGWTRVGEVARGAQVRLTMLHKV